FCTFGCLGTCKTPDAHGLCVSCGSTSNKCCNEAGKCVPTSQEGGCRSGDTCGCTGDKVCASGHCCEPGLTCGQGPSAVCCAEGRVCCLGRCCPDGQIC